MSQNTSCSSINLFQPRNFYCDCCFLSTSRRNVAIILLSYSIIFVRTSFFILSVIRIQIWTILLIYFAHFHWSLLYNFFQFSPFYDSKIMKSDTVHTIKDTRRIRQIFVWLGSIFAIFFVPESPLLIYTLIQTLYIFFNDCYYRFSWKSAYLNDYFLILLKYLRPQLFSHSFSHLDTNLDDHFLLLLWFFFVFLVLPSNISWKLLFL